MPGKKQAKRNRQETLLREIILGKYRTLLELEERLAQLGFTASQRTISRDLKEFYVAKSSFGKDGRRYAFGYLTRYEAEKKKLDIRTDRPTGDRSDTPWHRKNCPRGVKDKQGWSVQAEQWYHQLDDKTGYTIRTHMKCPACRFRFIFRTSNYSMSSTADVTNFGICCNPACRHRWEEYS